MMTPCVISDLSLPTENPRFSLPVCMFFANIAVPRLDLEYEAKSWDIHNTRPGLEANLENRSGHPILQSDDPRPSM